MLALVGLGMAGVGFLLMLPLLLSPGPNGGGGFFGILPDLDRLDPDRHSGSVAGSYVVGLLFAFLGGLLILAGLANLIWG